jgi:hypothetical protein
VASRHRLADADLKITEQAIAKVVDPTVNGKLVAAFPRSNNGWEAAKNTRLCDDVELTQTLPARIVIGK